MSTDTQQVHPAYQELLGLRKLTDGASGYEMKRITDRLAYLRGETIGSDESFVDWQRRRDVTPTAVDATLAMPVTGNIRNAARRRSITRTESSRRCVG